MVAKLKRFILVLCVFLSCMILGCGRKTPDSIENNTKIYYKKNVIDLGITMEYKPSPYLVTMTDSSVLFGIREELPEGEEYLSKYAFYLTEEVAYGKNRKIAEIDCDALLSFFTFHEDGNECFGVFIILGEECLEVEFSINGEEIKRAPIFDKLFAKANIAYSVKTSDNGYLCVGTNELFLLSSKCEVVWKTECQGERFQNVCEADGRLYATYQDSKGQAYLAEYNKTTGMQAKCFEISGDGRMLKAFAEGRLLLLDEENLFSFSIDTGESSSLVDLKNSNLNANRLLDVRGTSSFKVLSWNYSKGVKPIQLITLEPSDEVPQIDKVTLTLYDPYSLAEDLIGSHIFDDFNDENEKYRIEIMSGNANIQTVLAGEDTPDLFFSLFSEDISRLYSKGYLTDLFLLMNENSKIQPDDICEPVLKKFSVDGKLYAIPKYIALSTLMVKKEQVPYSEGWTVDEFLSWLEENAVVSTLGLEKGKILDFCLQGSMESFVTPDTHSADFEDGRFADILERIGKMKYPNKVETILTDISKKDTILLDEYLQQISLLLLNEYKYGGEIINLGYPNENGSGTALIDSTTNIAILEKSKNKEGAFEFLEYCITYPMDELKAMKAELLGGVPEGTLWPLKSMWALESALVTRDKHLLTGTDDYYEVKESDIEKVQNIIDNAIAEPYEYYLIRNIISEECESFFAGQKSAKDVCSIIQSRVAILLSEME